MILAGLLSSSNYIIVNKDLIKVLGLHEAIIIGELCSEYNYWESINKLEKDNFFYSTRNNIEKNTGINAHYQKIAFKNLENKGILISKKMGIPCKKYYKINEEKLIEYLKMAKLPVGNEVMNKNETTSPTTPSQDNQQDEDDVSINNNNINNKKINNDEHTHEDLTDEEKNTYAKKVTMTTEEYQDLINRFGEIMTDQLIEQLSLYKQANGKQYDNDYAAILRWVTTKMHEIEKEEVNYKKFKNKELSDSKNKETSYNQREYPSGFLDSLYANKN